MLCNSGNKETHLFGRSSDKEDYRRIKGSHKVNANSNSVPSLACAYVRVRWHTFVHVRSGVCAITELSETRSMLQPLELHFFSPEPRISFFPSYCLLVLSSLFSLSVRGKDLLSDPSATSHLNSFTLLSIPDITLHSRFRMIPSR